MASGRSSPAFSADSDEDGVDLTDTHIAVEAPVAGRSDAAPPPADKGAAEAFDVEAFVKERDAALAYDDSSLSELDGTSSQSSSMAATPRQGGASGASPSAGNITTDIATRLDELERIMEASGGGTPEQKSVAKDARTALQFSSASLTSRSSVHVMGDLNMGDEPAATPSSSSRASQQQQQDLDLEAKLARLERVLADSPEAARKTSMQNTVVSPPSASDTSSAALAAAASSSSSSAVVPSRNNSGADAISAATAQLSVSALAASATGTMDDELANRLDRLEELLGPMNSPPVAGQSRQHGQAGGLSTGLRGRLGLQSYHSGVSTPGNVSDVDAHLARLDRLIGTSSPGSTPGGVRGNRALAAAAAGGGPRPPSSTATESAQAAIARGAALENQALRDRIVELESALDARGYVLEDMMLSSSGRGDPRPHGDPNREIARVRRAEASAKRALVSAEANLADAHAEISRLKNEHRRREASVRSEIEGLQQQLNHSEHRVRARETMIETLQERLQGEVRKAAQERERDRKVFSKVHGRSPRKGSVGDAKTGEIIAMYETQRRGMEAELASLRRDVRSLTMEVRDSENAKQRARQGGKGGNGGGIVDVEGADAERAGSLANKLEAETRRVEERSLKLRRKEEQLVGQMARMKEELGKAQEQHEKLLEVNTNLKMELDSRPTMRDWKRLQRMVELLQGKLRDAVDGEAAREDAERVGLRRVAGDDTSSLVRRDRENHRLRLHTLDALSRSSSIELLKSVCRILGIGGGANGTAGVAYLIEPSVERVQQVILAVPRMQAFVREVCKTMQVNPGTTLGVAMELGLTQLHAWESDRQSWQQLQRFRDALVNDICTRPVLSTKGGILPQDFADDARLLAEVKGLIAAEGKADVQEKYYAAAEAAMGEQPKELSNRIVAHFMQIFDVKSGVRGVLPKMNEVFLFTNEQNTFMSAARAMLGVSPHATTAAVMAELRERFGEAGGGGDGEKKGEDAEAKKDGQDSNLVEERRTSGGAAFTVTRRGVPGWSVKE